MCWSFTHLGWPELVRNVKTVKKNTRGSGKSNFIFTVIWNVPEYRRAAWWYALHGTRSKKRGKNEKKKSKQLRSPDSGLSWQQAKKSANTNNKKLQRTAGIFLLRMPLGMCHWVCDFVPGRFLTLMLVFDRHNTTLPPKIATSKLHWDQSSAVRPSILIALAGISMDWMPYGHTSTATSRRLLMPGVKVNRADHGTELPNQQQESLAPEVSRGVSPRASPKTRGVRKCPTGCLRDPSGPGLGGLPNANAKSQHFSYATSQIATLPPVVALNRNSKSQIAARYAAFWHAVSGFALASFL